MTMGRTQARRYIEISNTMLGERKKNICNCNRYGKKRKMNSKGKYKEMFFFLEYLIDPKLVTETVNY